MSTVIKFSYEHLVFITYWNEIKLQVKAAGNFSFDMTLQRNDFTRYRIPDKYTCYFIIMILKWVQYCNCITNVARNKRLFRTLSSQVKKARKRSNLKLLQQKRQTKAAKRKQHWGGSWKYDPCRRIKLKPLDKNQLLWSFYIILFYHTKC